MKEYRARKNLSCFRLLCQILYVGTALNGHLLTGPDLTHSLTGGLCRFHNRLISIESVEEAIQMVRVVQNVCARGGCASTSSSQTREVLDSIPDSERASGVQDVDLNHNELPVQIVLGVKWSVNSDTFSLKVVLDEKSATWWGTTLF